MDAAKTEAGATPVSETSPKSRSFKSWLEGFKARFSRKPSSVNPESGSPPNPENDTIPEAKPYKSKLDQKRETEKLRFTPRIFFHTAPVERVASIIEHGLFGNKDDPNVGDRFGYSLYFGFEHTHVRENMSSIVKKDPLQETPDNYVLTVWKGDVGLKKPAQDSPNQLGFRAVTGRSSKGEVPDSFYQASPLGELWTLLPQEIGRLPKDNFLSAIPLTKPIREEMVKLMVLAQAAVFDADEIKIKFEGLLKTLHAEIKGVEYANLAQMLTVSLERSLIASVVKPALERAKSSPKIRQMTGLVYGEPLKALWQAYAYRFNVNDKVSARYLDGAISQLSKVVQAQGINTEHLFQRFDQSIDQLKQGKVYDLRKEDHKLMGVDGESNYYGATTIQAAYWMVRNQMLGEFNFVKDL